MDVRAFFAQWEIYRLCIEHNTLHHREVETLLRKELAARTTPFRFLDLASGDATLTARVLEGLPVASYTAVDFSAPALGLARENTARLPCPRDFLETGFCEFLDTCTDSFDVIYLGLSLHHLLLPEKRAALADIHRLLSPGGIFFIFEPILHAGESRAECLERWHAHMAGPYDGFPAPAREAVWDHVRTSDHPESVEEYLSTARAAGFSSGAVLFEDPGHFYALMRFFP